MKNKLELKSQYCITNSNCNEEYTAIFLKHKGLESLKANTAWNISDTIEQDSSAIHNALVSLATIVINHICML